MVHIPGYEPAFEWWQVLYSFLIMLSMCMLVAGLFFDFLREDRKILYTRTGTLWALLALIGALYASMVPVTLPLTVMLHSILARESFGAAIVSGALTVLCWFFFFMLLFPQRHVSYISGS